MQKKIAILGSTGSIGTQALQVIEQHPDKFSIIALTANYNAELLIKQALQFNPKIVAISQNEQYPIVKNALSNVPIIVLSGEEGLIAAVTNTDADIVLTAVVGFVGLKPTLAAIESKKTIALANKETLVVAGHIVTKLAQQNNVQILPVDSEHSAIFQCLVGENQADIDKIILTASGGPFRNYSQQELDAVTPAQALKHPNWNMGNKITIDSATMMNKGLEVIEAHHLFNLPPEKIDVIIHPQSIIHSFVQFNDGNLKAQLATPDMRLPIQYALTYPHRLPNAFPKFQFTDNPTLTFEKPNISLFPTLTFAYEVLKQSGNLPCALNAANEVAVQAFLNHQISFTKIFTLLELALTKTHFISNPSLDQLFETDSETRKYITSQL